MPDTLLVLQAGEVHALHDGEAGYPRLKAVDILPLPFLGQKMGGPSCPYLHRFVVTIEPALP